MRVTIEHATNEITSIRTKSPITIQSGTRVQTIIGETTTGKVTVSVIDEDSGRSFDIVIPRDGSMPSIGIAYRKMAPHLSVNGIDVDVETAVATASSPTRPF